MSRWIIESKGTLRPMLRLVAPVLVEQTLHMLVGFSDSILAGQYLQEAELAAMGMMNYLMWFVFTMFSVVAIGGGAVVARWIGMGRRGAARRATCQSFVLGAALTVLLLAIGWPLAGSFIRAINLQGATAALAERYLRGVLLVLPLIMIEEVGIACLRGAGDTVSGLIAMTAVNVVNVALSWSLVAGVAFLPNLGWDGLIVGTICGHATGGVIVAALLIGGRAGLRPAWRWLKPDRAIIRRLLRIGVPGGADSLVVVFCHLWFVAVVNRLGDLATAAHGVAIRVESMAYMPGFAFHVAAATLAGQYLGAGDMPRAKRSSWTTLAVGGGVMSAIGLLMFSLPETMVRIFVRADQTEVIASASSLVRIVSLTMPALAAASILGGALRGAGDTRWPLLFTLGSMLCVRIPGAYLLSQHAVSVPLMDWTIEGAGLGIVGAWYAMAIDITIRAALTAGRFKQGAWQHVKV